MKTNKYYKNALEILKQMTLKEKIGQVSQTVGGYKCFERNGENFTFTDSLKDFIKEYGTIGAVSNILRADGFTNHNFSNGVEARHRVKIANAFQKYIIENTRLKIPAFIEVEANHGLQALDSVMFPTNIGMGCTFNPELYQKVMESVGKEIKLSANHIGFVTMFDMARDPRWGRVEEFFSEDPYLTSKFSESGVKGIKKGGALACCKHYCATGDGMGGINTAEVNIGERELHDLHLPAVKTAVDAGADVVMAAYNTIDGIPCHMNSHLLRDVLRDELGFNGIVLSDGFGVGRAISQMGYDKVSGSAAILKAGIDLSLADGGWFLNLYDAINEGKVEEKLLDEAVLRILIKKFEFGLFDNPYIEDENEICRYLESGEQSKLAYHSAAESMVLLKNNGILPIKKSCKVALFGEHADNVYHLLGDYTAYQNEKAHKTIKQVFEECFDEFYFDKGWSFEGDYNFENAIKNAENYDVAFVTVGGTSARNITKTVFDENNGAAREINGFLDCGEACDVASLELPGNQMELIRALKATGKKVVAVLIGGRPYELTELDSIADGIIAAWYPGIRGAEALRDVIIGKVNPSGKLSVSFPVSADVLPVYYNSFLPPPADAYDTNSYINARKRVIYPFGYGLSYSKFQYNDISVTENGENKFEVTVTVENISDIDGFETVQLYIHGKGNSVRRRYRELKGFQKVFLKAHTKKEIKFMLGYEELKVWSMNNCFETENAVVEIFAGSNPNLPLKCTIKTT
ncbi:MAG: glycoside hydrolase family 3 C-terminal domain-containing protein [Clostridia bacterium]|nr:glycoside hydrolase family 3 C-terminal domain-containing protein [Clostridia bacterium]